MTRQNNILLYVVSSAFCIALIVASVIYIQKNEISRANALKRKAKREYTSENYVSAYTTYRQLIDSMEVVSEAADLNYANAAFFTSSILAKRSNDPDSVNPSTLADSTLELIAEQGKNRFLSLTLSSDDKLASMAHNQLGYTAFKRHEFSMSFSTDDPNSAYESGARSIDSLYLYLLDNFKQALRKDPSNDSIRFNYELLKRMINYPETILEETKALVARRQYREAKAVLEEGMKRDFRLQAQQEFLQRLRTVIQIDSLHSKGS